MKRNARSITILITVLSGILTAASGIFGNIASSQIQGLQFAWPVFCLLTLGGISLTVWQSLRQERPVDLSAAQDRRNRHQLLARVHNFWVAGVLERSLHGAVLIALGLQERPDAVTNPWKLVFEQSDQAPRLLPEGISISQVYDDAGGELLILGEPGSGKTTLLLELTRDRLERVRGNMKLPMPVVFNLSSWAVKRQPIATWLVEELNVKYQISRQLAQVWVDQDQILPLLDGLDEVAVAYRAECIRAINVYRQERNLNVPLVICSRRADYFDQRERLQLRNAVIVQPLTSQQVDVYLSTPNDQLALLRVAIRHNSELQTMVRNPFMLNVLVLAYQRVGIKDLLMLSAEKSPQIQQQYIFAAYVRNMLDSGDSRRRYTSQQATHWLNWLAKQLVKQKQTEFYIERMQMSWLPDRAITRLLPGLVIGALQGLIVGLIYVTAYAQFTYPTGAGILIGIQIGLFNALFLALLNGVIFGFLGKAEKGKGVNDNRGQRWRERLKQTLPRFLRSGLFYGAVCGILNVLWFLRFEAPLASLLAGSVLGISYGLVGKVNTDIRPAEVVVWSWNHIRRSLIKFLVSGLVITIFVGMIVGPLYFFLIDLYSELRYYGLQSIQEFFQYNTIFNFDAEDLRRGLSYGLIFCLIFGLIFMLTSGLSHELLDEHNRVKPNQGIRNSVRNSISLGVVAGLLFGLLSSVFYKQFDLFNMPSGLAYGIPVGLGVAFVLGLRSGGMACLQHMLLRVHLWLAGYAPLNYPRFLDDASERYLLRKVGGGYIFLHRLLLEYFATLTTSSPQVISRRAVVRGIAGLGVASIGGWLTWSVISRNPRLLYVYRGHSQSVNAVTWSADSQFIASGSDDNTVQQWYATTGEKISANTSYSASVFATSWSPNSRYLASGSDDKTVQVWEALTGKPIFKYMGHLSSGRAVAWSPNGQYLASGSDDGTLYVWKAFNGEQVYILKKFSYWYLNAVNAVAWAPNGQYLVSGTQDGTVQVWNAT